MLPLENYHATGSSLHVVIGLRGSGGLAIPGERRRHHGQAALDGGFERAREADDLVPRHARSPATRRAAAGLEWDQSSAWTAALQKINCLFAPSIFSLLGWKLENWKCIFQFFIGKLKFHFKKPSNFKKSHFSSFHGFSQILKILADKILKFQEITLFHFSWFTKFLKIFTDKSKKKIIKPNGLL